MAVLKAYMDESGKDEDPGTPIVAVGGMVGSVAAWSAFEEGWSSCLAEWKIPYLHLKEIDNKGEGPFGRFHEDKALMWKMLASFIDVIAKSGLFPVAHMVIKEHVRQFNRETSTRINCYALALYGCLIEFSIKHGGEPIEVVVDKFDNAQQSVNMARGYGLSDRYYKDCLSWLDEGTIIPLRNSESFRTVLPIQAADLVVWELRRRIWEMRDFLLNHKSGDDPHQWHAQQITWSLKRFGEWPHARPSLSLFGSIAPVENMVWDHRALGIAHEARGGSW